MSSRTLSEIKESVERLDLSDQVRLLEYLTPKIASAVLANPRTAPGAEGDLAWRQYRSLGQRLAASSVVGAPSLTDAVSQMRR
jgi:hypothetical protein